MNDPDQPTRWRHGGADAPEGFDALAPAQQDAVGTDDAALGRIMERLAVQVAAPALVTSFRALQTGSHAGRPRAEEHADALRSVPRAGFGSLAKLVAGVSLLSVLGLAVVALRSGHGPRPLEPSRPSPAASTVVATPATAPAPSVQQPTSVDRQPAAAGPAEAAPATAPLVDSRPKPTRQADTVTELSLLESAQRALRTDPRRALALVGQHRRHFPRGDFAQEREVLAIEALLALGRSSQAVALERAFEKRYPDSSHLPHLRDLVPATP